MRKPLVALTALLVVLAAAALPAGAGASMGSMSISPTTGDGGTLVTFTPSTACPNVNNSSATTNAPGDSYAAISLVPEPDPSDFIADTVVDGDGFWTLTYTVPEDAPAGDITFYGFCLYENYPVVDEVSVAAVPDDSFVTSVYNSVVFTVTVPQTTTTTSTSTTSTTTAPAPTLVASPTSVEQGGTIAIDAKGFKPGSEVVVTLESDPVNLGTFVADSAGRIATNVVVPADFPTGSHTLKLTGIDIAGSVLVLSTGITVASRIQVAPTSAPTTAPAVTGGATLPRTGSSMVEPALIAGAGLVLLGSVALVAARRRRAPASR